MSIGTTLLTLILLTGPGGPADDRGHDEENQGGYCSATAAALFKACGFEVRDDLAKALARCINVSDSDERRECRAAPREARAEGEKTCRRQKRWRLAACERLGEGRYDPEFDPASFDDPRHPTSPNPYFPLNVGSAWEYRGGDEVNTVEVLDRTKLIDGVTCLVVNDQVFKDGDLAEDTDDWYALAKDGNVWYWARGRQARHHLPDLPKGRPGLPRGVLTGERRGRDRSPVHNLRARRRPGEELLVA